MMRNSKPFLALALLLAAASCKTVGSNSVETSQLGAATSSRWTDSVLTSLTLREKAAQIVWPSSFLRVTGAHVGAGHVFVQGCPPPSQPRVPSLIFQVQPRAVHVTW